MPVTSGPAGAGAVAAVSCADACEGTPRSMAKAKTDAPVAKRRKSGKIFLSIKIRNKVRNKSLV